MKKTIKYQIIQQVASSTLLGCIYCSLLFLITSCGSSLDVYKWKTPSQDIIVQGVSQESTPIYITNTSWEWLLSFHPSSKEIRKSSGFGPPSQNICISTTLMDSIALYSLRITADTLDGASTLLNPTFLFSINEETETYSSTEVKKIFGTVSDSYHKKIKCTPSSALPYERQKLLYWIKLKDGTVHTDTLIDIRSQ